MLSADAMEDIEVFRQNQTRPDDVLTAVVTPRLYRKNPFRLTGAGVLAGPRDVARRIDQLKMAAELALPVTGWAFAPDWALTLDALRAVTQMVKDPKARLLQELFWFWPDNYPDGGETPVLDLLAQGETETGLAQWSHAAEEGNITAWHNLAVYHHLLALDWEKNEETEGEPPRELWNHAAQYWQLTLEDNQLWERLQRRVTLLGDAQLPAGFVDRLRTELPDALAGINAALAFQHAEHGWMDRALFHVSLVEKFHRQSPDRSMRHLESAVLPGVRRIEIKLAESRAALTRDSANSLVEAESLVRGCAGDLKIIAALCGETSDCYRELSHQIVDTALSGLVLYQRSTADNRRCLPLLVHLFDFEGTPELSRRLESTFQLVFENAASGEHHDVTSRAPFVPALPASAGCARRLDLITGEIVPGIAQLKLEGAEATDYAVRTVGMLKELAYAASRQFDDLDLALRAFGAALELPAPADLLGQLAALRDALQQEHLSRKEKELVLEAGGTALVIDARGIAWDNQWTSPADIIGWRHGVFHEVLEEGSTVERLQVGWSTSAREFALHADSFATETQDAAHVYQRIVEALHFFIAPAVVERLAAMIKRGEPVMLGESALSSEGVMLDASRVFWKRAQLVPYSKLQHQIQDGTLVLSSLEDPKLSQSYDIARTWNAAIIGRVIDLLAGR